MKKLRLLITDKCNKKCKGCCNKEWNLKSLPIINPSEYKEYDEILITGGEPTTEKDKLDKCIEEIFEEVTATITKEYEEKGYITKYTPKIYIYTNGYNIYTLFRLLQLDKIDGVTYTLHTQEDISNFITFYKLIKEFMLDWKSLRLNIFNGVKLPLIDLSNWKVRSNIKWIKDCPLPKDEEFKRYE